MGCGGRLGLDNHSILQDLNGQHLPGFVLLLKFTDTGKTGYEIS